MKSFVSLPFLMAILLILDASPGFAGGECAPKMRDAEAKLAEMPASTTKEEASKLLEAAQKAADNYNDEGCVEHVEEALAKIAQAG